MHNEYLFRKAQISDIPEIWIILQKAIQRRKEEGSNQWQDGYPNPEVIQNDIEKESRWIGSGEVLMEMLQHPDANINMY